MMITATELAKIIDAEVVGDGSLELHGVAKIEEAKSDEVAFVANRNYFKFLDTTDAGAVIVGEIPDVARSVCLVTQEPYIGFLKALRLFHPEQTRPSPGIHSTVTISPQARVSENVSIGPLCVIEEDAEIGEGTIIRAQCYIGNGAKIGNDCLIYSHVTIREQCRIGNHVILQDGVVIGSDGFGFAPQDQGYLKVPQVGIVVIEDDVEIGANTTVDRATLGETRIRKGVKLDNLIQIAHNVEIGENTVIAAQTGIAGSTKLGKGIMLGGQVAINGHINISDGVMAAARSGISKDPGEKTIVGGTPAREIGTWRRIEASLSRLPELIRRVKALEKKIDK
ncbi:MAG: UDP-3-O-(3-hydroxymyristoyl)glucosamine N-acyltransferase [Candidatus Electryonea clarkiae]|nr:UDP-3-O-(3-hydroxymyristoyl)glucosamine N-acyltransferase [Candidatus Electryonea clarkiae]MDP8287941.1 UDP-3-O-(3-hydroxymyristoyl)glucosamine N-acyltransferase [Candidatus Electryonea clarkiae]